MKKYFTLIAFALIAVSASAQVATFSATGRWTDRDEVTVDPTTTAGKIGRVIVSFENTAEIVGYQFDLALPEGVTKVGAYQIPKDYIDRYVAYDAEVVDDETGEVSSVPTNLYVSPADFQVEKADGSIYIPVMQNPNAAILDEATKQLGAENLAIKAGSGQAGFVNVRVPDDFEGPATIKFKEVKVVTMNETGDNTVSNPCDDFEVQLIVVPTGIQSVEAQTLTGKEIFNLSGQRVSKPSQRGIYIVDGKKVYVK